MGAFNMRIAAIENGGTERAQRYLKAGEIKPSALLLEHDLTPREKRWILKQRIVDLDAELRAADESMTSQRTDVASERLREAHRALLLLDAPEDGSPTE
jgi:hypothetical protein